MVDLNVDAGEGEDDAPLLAWATSVNVACGYHAGDAATMAAALAAAVRTGCAVGAHPSYPDREGFGRRPMDRTPDQLAADVRDQLEALASACASAGTRLHHVKPHGALYHATWRDHTAARAVAQAVAEFDASRSLWLYTPPGSALAEAARALGLPVAREGFADRGVTERSDLVPRGTPGAVIADPGAAATRAATWVREGRVRAGSGAWVAWAVDTLCVHSDTPNAAGVLRAVRGALDALRIRVRAPGA